MPETKSNSR